MTLIACEYLFYSNLCLHDSFILALIRFNVKGLYSTRHAGRSSSEDEEEEKLEGVADGKGSSPNPLVKIMHRKDRMVGGKKVMYMYAFVTVLNP